MIAAAETAADFTPIVGDVKGIAEAIADPSVANIAAAAVGIIPGAGDVAGKAIKAGGNIVENAAKGAAGEAAALAKRGDQIAGKQVTFKTSDGSRTRIDGVTKDKTAVEVKTGNAKLSPGQAKLQADVAAGNPVTPVGANAERAGLQPNMPTTLNGFEVDREP